MSKTEWRGTREELYRLYDDGKFDEIVQYFKDNETTLIMYAECNNVDDLTHLSRLIKLGRMVLSYLEEHIKKNPKEGHDLAYPIGHIKGVLSSVSRINYSKLENHIVANRAKEANKYFYSFLDFDALVLYLYEHNSVPIETVVADLGIQIVTLKECIRALEETGLINCRRLSEVMKYLELSDMGRRHAKYLKFKEHPENYGWD